MIFEYKSLSSDTVVNVTSGSSGLGSVIMATDYNVYNPDFTTKQQMENYEFAVSCKPSVNMIHMVEQKHADLPLKDYYINDTNDFPAQGDARMTYPAKFQIATVGNTANATAGLQNTLGEIWCSYEVELKRPRIYPGNAVVPFGKGAFDHFRFNGNSSSTISPLFPFGTETLGMLAPVPESTLQGAISGGIVSVQNQEKNYGNAGGGYGNASYKQFPVVDAGGNQIPSTANTYYFPKSVSSGTYYFSYSGDGYFTSGTLGTPAWQLNNAEFALIFSGSAAGSSVTEAVTTILQNATVKVTGPNASITLTWPAAGMSGGSIRPTDIFVMEI